MMASSGAFHVVMVVLLPACVAVALVAALRARPPAASMGGGDQESPLTSAVATSAQTSVDSNWAFEYECHESDEEFGFYYPEVVRDVAGALLAMHVHEPYDREASQTEVSLDEAPEKIAFR